MREKLDWISIRDLRAECVIGVHAEERDLIQTVVVDVALGLPLDDAGRNGRLSETVDYTALSGQLTFLLRVCQFRLIETAAWALARYILAPPALGERRAQVREVRLELHKPAAMQAPAVARVSIERDASSMVPAVEEKSFGTVDVICITSEVGIYRLNIAPGKEIPLHVHRIMDEHELVLSSGLVAQDEAVLPGAAFHWPLGAPHRYRNPSDSFQTVLCVDRPPFVLTDEVEVMGQPARIVPQYFWPPRNSDGWAMPPDRP